MGGYSQGVMRRLGAAVLLRSACTPATATWEQLVRSRGREHRQAAHCSQRLVRHLLGATDVERGERRQPARCSQRLVGHPASVAKIVRSRGEAVWTV
jgi:hypothetical protein